MDDAELLKDFADTGSEDSFKTLVDRHINLVYSVARHTTRDPHLAEEVAQSVFIILAKKAGKLGNVKALSAWLYRTTRLAAVQSVRNECRRREREEKFASMDHTVAEPNWEQIEPHLAEVIDQLGETDRTAIVLRFFESRSLKDVARTLGTGEDAARMRVNRALEKLRRLFVKRGVALPTAILASAISSYSVQAAPAKLATSVATAAITQKSIVTTSALVKGTLKLMAWTKFKTAALAGAVLLLFGGTTAVVVNHSLAARNLSPLSPDQKAVLAAAKSLASALARGDADAFAASIFTPNDPEGRAAGRRLAASLGSVAKGMAAVDAALRARFGDTDDVWRIRYTFSMESGIPLLGYEGHQTQVEVAGDKAFFRCLDLWPSHKEMPLIFVRSDGQWKLVVNPSSRRTGWLERAIVDNELYALKHEQFALELRDGLYKTPQQAWQAWTGNPELPNPSIPRRK
ncbi:MAG TPA: sigma-70 family RNA polymerase sigma factor [Verrucomicrobiae bacterium]|nr:sigma-70 family RNA polymerase sigma factor [Verrucomicrobiae bacterium]